MNLSIASGGFSAAHVAHATYPHLLLPDEAQPRASETAATSETGFAIDQVRLRHLNTLAEIEQILHLREEIDLSVHSAAGADFHALEKKETSAALSVPSS